MHSSLPFNYMFMLTMFMGTSITLSSTHWLMMWIGLEVNLIGFLPLIVYMKKSSEGEAAVKYFIVQSMSSAFIVLGSLMTYSISFSWDLYNMTMGTSLGGWMLLSGLLLKLGLFPFHYWIPSVMAGMSWFSCLVLATWQKLAPLFLLLYMFESFSLYEVQAVLCSVAMGSSLIGGIGGLNQTQLRALLAYSSIGHLGWMLLSAMVGEWVMKVYLLVYVLISLCLFSNLWMSNSNSVKNMISVGDLHCYYGLVMMLLLSLAGLPPLIGFMSKMVVILVVATSPWGFSIFIMILGSLMSLFYYLGLFFSMLLSRNKSHKNQLESYSMVSKGGVWVMAANFMGGLGLYLMNLIYYV